MRYLITLILIVLAVGAYAQTAQELSSSLRASFKNNNYEAAERLLTKLLELDPENLSNHYNMVCTKSMLGKTDEALNELEQMIANGYVSFGHINSDSDLDNIRGTDRFKKIFEELKARFKLYVFKQFGHEQL